MKGEPEAEEPTITEVQPEKPKVVKRKRVVVKKPPPPPKPTPVKDVEKPKPDPKKDPAWDKDDKDSPFLP